MMIALIKIEETKREDMDVLGNLVGEIELGLTHEAARRNAEESLVTFTRRMPPIATL